MATAAKSEQRFVIDGDLQITTHPSTTGTTLGRVVFIDTVAGEIGSLKVYGGGPGYYRLILDTSQVQRGISFRTYYTQGGSDEGGGPGGYAYCMDVQNSYIRLGNYTIVNPLAHRYPTGDFTSYLFKVEKQAATASYGFPDDQIARYVMRTFLPGQSSYIYIGQDYNGTALGHREPSGYTGSGAGASDAYGFLGMTLASGIVENLKTFKTGNVSIPLRLDVGTLNATTYLNLPPVVVPASELVPITLDKTNNRVGVNNTTPTEALDVTGNATVSGTVTAGTVSATTYVGLPPVVVPASELVPITLDKTNNRVGVNNTSPTQALDVIGNATVSGTVTAGTVSATTYVGLPPVVVPASELVPITLDKTNNRVGVNTTTPTQALDVTGNINTSGRLTFSSSTIVLSADASISATTGSNRTFISPIRSSTNSNLLLYDTTSKEVTSTTDTTFLSPITLDKTNNRVGINVTNPGNALSVIGNGFFGGFLASTNGLWPNGIGTAAVLRAGTGTPEASVTANVGSLFMRQDGAENTTLYTKVTGTGTTGWAAIAQRDPSVGTSIMVRNSSLSIVATTQVFWSLPTTNALVTEWNNTSSETTTQVLNTTMGVTIEKAAAQGGRISFTKNGTYTITLRWKFAASITGDFEVQPEFRLNGVNLGSNGYYNTQNSVANAFASRQELVFTRYIDISIVNQLFIYIYCNGTSSSNIDFTIAINKLT